jgi:hypothetical protein
MSEQHTSPNPDHCVACLRKRVRQLEAVLRYIDDEAVSLNDAEEVARAALAAGRKS